MTKKLKSIILKNKSIMQAVLMLYRWISSPKLTLSRTNKQFVDLSPVIKCKISVEKQ